MTRNFWLISGCFSGFLAALAFGLSVPSTGMTADPNPPKVLSPQGLSKFHGTWTEPSASPKAQPVISSSLKPSDLAANPSEPSPAPEVEPTPEAPRPLGKTNLATLRNSFEKALSEERMAVAHRHKMEMRELKASQRQAIREWMAREKNARVEFFEKTESGNAKANWMKDRKQRYARLKKDQESELSELRKSHDLQRKQGKQAQDERRKAFESSIRSGFFPPRALWSPLPAASPSPSVSPSPGVSPSASPSVEGAASGKE